MKNTNLFQIEISLTVWKIFLKTFFNFFWDLIYFELPVTSESFGFPCIPGKFLNSSLPVTLICKSSNEANFSMDLFSAFSYKQNMV
jgi:hypothetical protein